MTGQHVLAALLLVVGVASLAATEHRPSLRDRLQECDGGPSEDGRRLRSTVVGVLATAGLAALPVWLWSEGFPLPVVGVLAVLVAGVLASAAVELVVRLRGRGTAVAVPLTSRFQRRLAVRLVGALAALRPVPPLRPAARPRAARPTAPSSTRSATRLLVLRLPPDVPGVRLWDLAEQYLGSRLRYRDLLTLNRHRSTPDGAPLTEETVLRDGWTLLVPGDARGPGLVVLPAVGTPGARPAGAGTGAAVAPPPPVRPVADAGPAEADVPDVRDDAVDVAPVRPGAARPDGVADRGVLPADVPGRDLRPVGVPDRDARPVGVADRGAPGVRAADRGGRPVEVTGPDVRPVEVVDGGVRPVEVAGPDVRPVEAAADVRPVEVAADVRPVEVADRDVRPRAAPPRVAGSGGGQAGGAAPRHAHPGTGGDLVPRGDRSAGRPVVEQRAAAGRAAPPRAALAWDLVHARLLADGVLDTLSGLRERRRYARRPGENVPLPDAAAVRVEESAHVGAAAGDAEFLEAALRLLAAGCTERGLPWPVVAVAHLGPEALQLRLATPDREPPPPFEASASGSTWTLDRAVPLDDVPDVSPRLPGLVGLGPDPTGRLLVNLPTAGVISLTGPEDGCRMVATTMAVELVVKRWAEAPVVNLVGFGDELAELSPRLRCHDRVTEVLDRPVRGDVVVLAEPPTDVVLTALRTGPGSDWFGAPAVIVVGEHRRARWNLELGADGILTCAELDIEVGAQALAPATARSLARLLATERSTGLAGVSSSTVQLPRRVDAGLAEVVLHLFGPPRLTRGDEVLDASGRTVEIVALLALLGSATPYELAAALWPRGVDRHTVRGALREAAETLGSSTRGAPLLVVGDTVELAPEVQLDWHLFVSAAATGDDAAALGLLGPTAADDIEGGLRRWAWMARSPLVRQLPGYVADVALRRDRHLREMAARRTAPAAPATPLVRI